MSIRRLGDGGAAQAEAPNPNIPTNGTRQQPSSVMPVGPDVDVGSILGPLIDGSYSQAQGQAAIMAGVRTPAPDGSTAPIKSTAPLPGIAPLPGNAGAPGQAQTNMRVPPQLVQGLVQRILAGMPTETQLTKTPEVEQLLAGRFTMALSQIQGNLPPGGQEALYSAVMDEILGFGPLEPLLNDE